MKYILSILITVLFSCQQKYDLKTFIKSEPFNVLFSETESEFFFENIVIKDLIDSVLLKCEEQEYTGDYNVVFRLNQKENLKYKIGIKGFVCPRSLKDHFYNPLNIYHLENSIFIEKNLNSHNPTENSAEFGEYLGVESITEKNLKRITKDSLKLIVRKHLEISFSEYTYSPLIQIITNDSIKVGKLKSLFNIALKEYYNIYTELSKKIHNKHLEELNTSETKRIVNIINDSELKGNFRINSIQRIQQQGLIKTEKY